MDKSTPRGIIRGVLTAASVENSSRSLRSRKTAKSTRQKNTLVNPPSEREVASSLLNRTRSASKRKRPSSKVNMATPSDVTTPRTLITGFLKTAAVTKSTAKGKRQKLQDTGTAKTSKKQSKGISAEDARDETPRTIIQNYLREAMRESPEEVPVAQSKTDSDDETKRKTKGGDEESVIEGSVSQDNTELETSTPPVVNQDIMLATSGATPLVEETNAGEMDLASETSHAFNSESTIQEEEVLDSQPSIVTPSLETDRATRNSSQTSNRWRDLVTPQLPLAVSLSVAEEADSSHSHDHRFSAQKSLPSRKPPAGKSKARPSRNKGPRMPSSLVKSIFQHFSKAKLSKEALEAVENGSNLFFKQVSLDLMAFSRHAHRSTIELADVELLMKRQGFITESQSLSSLVEKYLPLEYRQEIIPIVRAGNVVQPK